MVKFLIVVLIISMTPYTANGQTVPNDIPALVAQKSRLLFVTGWSESEFRQILSDFAEMYSEDKADLGLGKTHSTGDDHILVVFPSSLNPTTFQFLVNYTHYPNHFDLSGRQVVAVGLVELDEDFESSMSGKGVFYVPVDDTEYDEVFAMTEFDEIYRISFTNHLWVPQKQARNPALAKSALSLAMPAE